MSNRINFVTGNRSKFLAFEQLVRSYNFEAVQIELPILEPQFNTVEAVSHSKALQAFQFIHEPVVVEDSGFLIDELSGFPGPYTKYVLETIDVDGLVRLAIPLQSKACRFISVLTYVEDPEKVITFTDTTGEGTIAPEVDQTLCEDSWSDLWRIFIPRGVTQPMTAISAEERRRLIEQWGRGSVYTQFASWLRTQRLTDIVD